MTDPAELSPAEIDAIVALLTDGDADVDRMITVQLLKRPAASRRAVLDRAEAAGVWTAMRLGGVLRLNRREGLAARFAALPRDSRGEIGLEAGAFLVARIGRDDFDEAALGAKLDQWAEDIHMALPPRGEPAGALEALLTVLFKRLGFHGEQDEYYVPANSLLPHVMRTKVGLPITLAVIVLLVAQRLALPVDGIGMPGHFMLRYRLPDEAVYLDAFDGGTLLTAEDCYGMVRRMGHPTRDALAVAGPTSIVARMLGNLAHAYERTDDPEGVADCQACLASLTATAPARG